MKQTRFEWDEQNEEAEPVEVALDRETTEALIVLMARVLVAVVRTVQEADDER